MEDNDAAKLKDLGYDDGGNGASEAEIEKLVASRQAARQRETSQNPIESAKNSWTVV